MGGGKEVTRTRWNDVLSSAQEEEELDDQEKDVPKDKFPICATLRNEGNQQVTYADRVRYEGPPNISNIKYRRYDRRDNRSHAGRNTGCHHC